VASWLDVMKKGFVLLSTDIVTLPVRLNK